ncbi:MAG: hypothetical protein P8Y97_04650, partial [Candidatus Lokiarchaeota archaeon]
MNYFQNSKYLEIIKIIGDSLKPVYNYTLKSEIGLSDSSLYRKLIWLQNIENENGIKKDNVKALTLKKDTYIKSTGKAKSKKNTYQLTKKGWDIYNSLFLDKEEFSFMDDLIQDFEIYDHLWNYIESNRKLFYIPITNELAPWTFQMFEFFEETPKSEIEIILKNISGPTNLKIYNLFGFLTKFIFTHPLWKNRVKEKGLKVPEVERSQLKQFENIPHIKDKFEIFGVFPNFFCILKSDSLLKEIRITTEKQLETYYWLSIKNPIHEKIIRDEIMSFVINNLSIRCPEYSDFIEKHKIDLSIFTKRVIEEDCKEENQKTKIPLNLLHPIKRRKYESHLRKKLCVYNYSTELSMKYEFYNKFKTDIIEFVENLINELIDQDLEFHSYILEIAFIFYSQKYRMMEKAIQFNEKLLNIYPNEEKLYENLLHFYFKQSEWNMNKIQRIMNEVKNHGFVSPCFSFTSLILNLIEGETDLDMLVNKEVKNISGMEIVPIKLYHELEFFTTFLNENGYHQFTLQLTEAVKNQYSDFNLRLIHAKNLTINKKFIPAIEEYLRLIDLFPNRYLEDQVIEITHNPHNDLSELKENKNLDFFLKRTFELLNLLSKGYTSDIFEDPDEFRKRRKDFLSDLRSNLKKINKLLKNPYSLTFPLKIKAIILKALDRNKNLESCLNKILKIAPNSLWAIAEKTLLFYKQGEYEKAFNLVMFLKESKERVHYPYTPFSLPLSFILKTNDYSIFRFFMKAGKYYEASLMMEEFLLNPYSVEDFRISAKLIGKDLIKCYSKISRNTDEVVYKILDLTGKMDKNKNKDSNYVNVQKNSSDIRQSLIDYLFENKKYNKCLNLISKLSKSDSNILKSEMWFFTSFNKNIFYLAECHLKLFNLVKAKKYYEDNLEALQSDVRFKAKRNYLLIEPFPEDINLKNEKFYHNRINKGLEKIKNILKKKNFLKDLIFKTNIKRSIGNVSLLIKISINKEEDLFEDLQNQTKDILGKDREYLEIVLANSYAINGYINEMYKIVKKENIVNSYPIISTLLGLIYLYYKNDFKRFNKETDDLCRLFPGSLIPLLLKLYSLRFKMGISFIDDIKDLFKKILRIEFKENKIYGIESQVFNYLKENLNWFPFKWALDFIKRINDQKQTEINQLIAVLEFIEKKPNADKELFDFISRFMVENRSISNFLDVLLISKHYKYPRTKYYIFKSLKPEIDRYDLETFGEIAYKANKLREFLPLLEDYRKQKFQKYKELNRTNWIINLEERYLTFLLKCYRSKELQAINAEQLLIKLRNNPELKWNDNYFKCWILSRLLFEFKEGNEVEVEVIIRALKEFLNFKKLDKDSIYFMALIIEVLNHELFEDYRNYTLKFGIKLFMKIMRIIKITEKKSLNMLLEKIYFSRELLYDFPVEIVELLDDFYEKVISNQIDPIRSIYIIYIKAMIYFKNNEWLK